MNERFLGVVAVVVTWIAVVYLIVAAMVFWDAIQRDRDNLSVQVVGRNVIRALFWITDFL